jgi:hypothetical protein
MTITYVYVHTYVAWSKKEIRIQKTWGELVLRNRPPKFQVIQAGVGLIMPEFLFSGILWPNITMYPWLKVITLFLLSESTF